MSEQELQWVEDAVRRIQEDDQQVLSLSHAAGAWFFETPQEHRDRIEAEDRVRDTEPRSHKEHGLEMA